MGIIAWLVFGALSGFIASKLMEGRGNGLLGNLLIGVVGSFLGGIIATALGGLPVTGFNLYSLLVAVLGGVVLLWLVNALSARRSRVP